MKKVLSLFKGGYRAPPHFSIQPSPACRLPGQYLSLGCLQGSLRAPVVVARAEGCPFRDTGVSIGSQKIWILLLVFFKNGDDRIFQGEFGPLL